MAMKLLLMMCLIPHIGAAKSTDTNTVNPLTCTDANGNIQWLKLGDPLTGQGTAQQRSGADCGGGKCYFCCGCSACNSTVGCSADQCHASSQCANSACVVAGYKNDARALCRIQKDKKDGTYSTTCASNVRAGGSYCKWHSKDCQKLASLVANNNTVAPHCYGQVKCQNQTGFHMESNTDCYGYNKFCLEAGNSAGRSDYDAYEYNFKVCTDDVPTISCSVNQDKQGWSITTQSSMGYDNITCTVTDKTQLSTKGGNVNPSALTPYPTFPFLATAAQTFQYTYNFQSGKDYVIECAVSDLHSPKDVTTQCEVNLAPPPPEGTFTCAAQSVLVAAPPAGDSRADKSATTSKEAQWSVFITQDKPADAVTTDCKFVGSSPQAPQSTWEVTYSKYVVLFSGLNAGNYTYSCTFSSASLAKTATCETTVTVQDTKPPSCASSQWSGWPEGPQFAIDSDTAALTWNVQIEDDEKISSLECSAKLVKFDGSLIQSLALTPSVPSVYNPAVASPVSEPYSAAFPLGRSMVSCTANDFSAIDMSGPATCEDDVIVCQQKTADLVAGQHCKVGTVTTTFINDILQARYEIADAYKNLCWIEEIHFEASPGTTPSMPATPGLFDVVQEGLEGHTHILAIKLEEAKAGTCFNNSDAILDLSIIAHAVVNCSAPVSFDNGHTCWSVPHSTETAYGSVNGGSLVAATGNWATYYNFKAVCACGQPEYEKICMIPSPDWGEWSPCVHSCGAESRHRFPKDFTLCAPDVESCGHPPCDTCTSFEITGDGSSGCSTTPCPVSYHLLYDYSTTKFSFQVKSSGKNLKSVKLAVMPSKYDSTGALLTLPAARFMANGLAVTDHTLYFLSHEVVEHCDTTLHLKLQVDVAIGTKTYSLKSNSAPLICRCTDGAGNFNQGWAAPDNQQSAVSSSSNSSWAWIATAVVSVMGTVVAVLAAFGGYKYGKKTTQASEAMFHVTDEFARESVPPPSTMGGGIIGVISPSMRSVLGVTPTSYTPVPDALSKAC